MNRVSTSEFSGWEELSSKIKNSINNQGYIIVSDLYNNITSLDELKATLLELCNSIGEVTSHNNQDTPIWDIKARDNNSEHITFSEHADEAELHTDSQYSKVPEDHFALYCIHKAQCNGGESFLLSVDDIITELNATKKGQEVIEFLESNTYPYIVPDVFKENPNGPPEFTAGYLLKNGEMRFRVDAVERALAIDSSLCSDEQIEVFNYLKKIVINSKAIVRTYLENHECLFINNKTMLHGRTRFLDQNRHLLRIRFNNKVA